MKYTLAIGKELPCHQSIGIIDRKRKGMDNELSGQLQPAGGPL